MEVILLSQVLALFEQFVTCLFMSFISFGVNIFFDVTTFDNSNLSLCVPCHTLPHLSYIIFLNIKSLIWPLCFGLDDLNYYPLQYTFFAQSKIIDFFMLSIFHYCNQLHSSMQIQCFCLAIMTKIETQQFPGWSFETTQTYFFCIALSPI